MKTQKQTFKRWWYLWNARWQKIWKTWAITAAFVFGYPVLIEAAKFVEQQKVIDRLNAAQFIQSVEAAEVTNEMVENQIREIAKAKNFPYTDYLIRLARCENLRFEGDKYDPFRTNTQNNIPKNSTDRGIFMINNYHHYEVSDAQASDLEWSTNWTIDRIMAGYQHEWSCNEKAKQK